METNLNNLEISQHYATFETAINEFINLLLGKSIEKINLQTEPNQKIANAHEKLRSTCNKILDGFDKTKENKNNFDKAKIIKKIYKTIVQNIELLVGTEVVNVIDEPKGKIKVAEPDVKFKETLYKANPKLFSILNEEGKVVTIIPGLDVNLIYNYFDQVEQDALWHNFYIIYVSAVRLITITNNYQKTGKVWDTLPIFEERITLYNIKLGLDKYLFNPFVGIESDGNVDVESMFANAGIKKSAGVEGNVLGMLGIENLINMDEVNEQIKNLGDEEIKDTTKNITKMLGAEQDSDISDICETLVSGIVDDLQKNGLSNMFETAQNVKNKLGNKLDLAKMKKTGTKLTSFMENAKNEFENMKDENGNPIGKDIFKQLEGPLNMMKFMNPNASAPSKPKKK